MNKQFDLIWIGTGQATMSILPRILKAGKTVAIIEEDKFGGTCVNSGCTPTKALVAAAKAIHQAKRGSDFGFDIGELKVDFEKVMEPQKKTRSKSTQGIESWLQNAKNCTVFKGSGEFTGSHTVKVGSEELYGKHIVINVGSRPRQVATPGAEAVNCLTNKSLLNLNTLPEHLAVVGGSYIGLEFAQIFRRLGSKVTVFERGEQLVFREDPDIAEIVRDVLSSEGIDIVYNSDVEQVEPKDSGDSVLVAYSESGIKKTLKASHILFAVGREPNSDKLGLSKAGVEVDRRGFIEVNQTVQTSQSHIYAVGDVNGEGAFTHTSVNDGEIFWDHYSRLMDMNPEPKELDRTLSMRTTIYSMFIDPPLARVGMSETEARKSKRNILMATLPMERIARAREKQETYGIVKIFVDKDSEQIVGATVFGTGGDEVIGIFAAFMQTKLSYKVLRRTVFPHPTVGELMPWIMDDLKPLNN
ncbi:mercuric reductase [Vibrio ishigakensis]|nr:mercuric reductase [Vibrio ishigakensis]